jgi:hypothetical protein
MYNTDHDSQTNYHGKTQITNKYPLNPHTNWYLYPEVFTLYCNKTPNINFGKIYGTTISAAPKVWQILTTLYKNNWQPHMDSTHHIYLMPTMSIDPATCGKVSVAYQQHAASTVANMINTSLLDGVMIDYETAPNHQTGQTLLNIIRLIAKDLTFNKRIAIYSGMHTNTPPNNPTSIWPILNRTAGCKQPDPTHPQPCFKGFWTPSIYDAILESKHMDGGIDDFYRQASYLISQQLMNLSVGLEQNGLLNTIKNNYYMQPALPGSSSANNAAAYITTAPNTNGISKVNTPGYWGKTYQASDWQPVTDKDYHKIRQAYPPADHPDPDQVHSCQYFCSGIASYSVVNQLLLQSKPNQYYTSGPAWPDIKNNLTETCGVKSNFNAWFTGGNTPVIPAAFIRTTINSGLANHLIGVALYQLNFSPLNSKGEQQDWMAHRCMTKECEGLNPYPSTMSPTSWTLLQNWLSQQNSNKDWQGWLANQPLPSSAKLSSLLNASLNCDGKRLG